MKDEMTIVLHLYEGTLELTVLILIPVIALTTVERKMIESRHIHIIGTPQKFIVFAESEPEIQGWAHRCGTQSD